MDKSSKSSLYRVPDGKIRTGYDAKAFACMLSAGMLVRIDKTIIAPIEDTEKLLIFCPTPIGAVSVFSIDNIIITRKQ